MTAGTASCRCGKLRVTVTGEPVRVSVCHCLNCKKRSGSAFAVQARWPKGQVEIEGASKTFAMVADSGNRAVLRRLAAAGVVTVERPRAGGGPLAGRTFVLTGALGGLTRDDATAQIQARGGRVSESVSRATDYVVVGEAPGRKLEQARRLGVPTLDEAQLQRRLARGGAA